MQNKVGRIRDNEKRKIFHEKETRISTETRLVEWMESLSAYANPMIKRVVIQMGMDKTATTSIQLFLSRNRVWLNENDLEYRTDWGADNHSVPLKSLVSKTPEKIHWHIVSGHSEEEVRVYNEKNLLALARGVQACQQGTYIIFGEGICGFKIHELRKLKKLIAVLMPMAKIELLYCVRSNRGYASSGYQQAVRMGQSYGRLKLIGVYSNIYFRRMIRAILVFGRKRMQVYEFEDTKRHAFGPAGFFIEKLGVATDGMVKLEMPTANESISFQATEIIEFINRKLPLVIADRINAKRMKGDIEAILKIKGCKYQLPASLITIINQVSTFDILWLKFAFKIQYPLFQRAHMRMEQHYDETYCCRFVEAFVESNEEIRHCLYNFIETKTDVAEDAKARELFVRIKSDIEDNYIKSMERLDDEKSML